MSNLSIVINQGVYIYIHTNSMMCIDAGELDGPVVASLRVLFVFLRHTFRRVSVGQAVIHQINLPQNRQNDKLVMLRGEKNQQDRAANLKRPLFKS